MVANLTFLKPDFEMLTFSTHWAFFENQKSRTKSGFFSVGKVTSGYFHEPWPPKFDWRILNIL